MLTRLTIERFKSIRLSRLELGRINLFIGGNGAGKSNVLEAIGVVSAALERGVSDEDLNRKGVRLTPPELMKSAFKFYELPKTLQITVEMEGEVQYRINLTGRQDEPLLSFFTEKCSYGRQKIFGRSHRGSRVLGKSILGNGFHCGHDRCCQLAASSNSAIAATARPRSPQEPSSAAPEIE